MAKRVAKWTVNEDGNVLNLSKALENNEQQVIDFSFPLVKLFPDFDKYNDVQKQMVLYATKQKLMDSGASDIADYDGKLCAAKRKWQELLDGKWTGERTNATGAAENKKLMGQVKDFLKADTLQGLMLKQALKPEQFTEEDQAKLNEFLQIAARGVKKQAS